MKIPLQAAIDGKADEQLNLALCNYLGFSPKMNYKSLPNHLTAPESLGLVHEIETTLGHHYLRSVEKCLQEVCGGSFRIFHATARQRVIAILKVVQPEVLTQVRKPLDLDSF